MMRVPLPFLSALLLGVAVAAALSPAPRSGWAQAASSPVIEARGGAVRLTPGTIQDLAPGPRKLARVAVSASGAPVLGPGKTGPAHQMLRRLVATGQAAGNVGDLYENRDRGHSMLPAAAHPQLTHVLYDPELRAQGQDYGLGLTLLFDAPLIGNSSTAFPSSGLSRWFPRWVPSRRSSASRLLS